MKIYHPHSDSLEEAKANIQKTVKLHLGMLSISDRQKVAVSFLGKGDRAIKLGKCRARSE